SIAFFSIMSKNVNFSKNHENIPIAGVESSVKEGKIHWKNFNLRLFLCLSPIPLFFIFFGIYHQNHCSAQPCLPISVILLGLLFFIQKLNFVLNFSVFTDKKRSTKLRIFALLTVVTIVLCSIWILILCFNIEKSECNRLLVLVAQISSAIVVVLTMIHLLQAVYFLVKNCFK
ncbi:unnamed protein product, partial [Caenorhabditis brenneri]